MKLNKICLIIILLFISYDFFSQEDSKNYEPLPYSYKGISLGMTLDETKIALIQTPEFGYNGDRDVSLVPGDNQILIETDTTNNLGSPFLTQCWFQFYNEKLYIMTINLNKNKIDYYSMFTTLTNKYGEPTTLDPQKTVWESDDIILILEKPLSVKYIDKKTYEQLKNYTNVQISAEEYTRELFLEEF